MNKHAKILIVDDEPAARYGMRKVLKGSGYLLEEAIDGEDALRKTDSLSPDLVLCDINMPKLNGIDFLHALKKKSRQPLVIVVTAYGSERIAVEAMKAGAYDYLSKPYEIDDLRLTVRKAVEKLNLENENIQLKKKLAGYEEAEVIGESEAIRNVLNMIDKVAPTDVSVLITGESGTGKELVARTIHKKSQRTQGPFITMNCAAIPINLIESELFGHEKGAFTGAAALRKGKFEIADAGTLFLDEIADMSLETQAKILRVLEERSFTRLGGKDFIHSDVRLISATNKNLNQEIASNRFREDLFYRIKVVEIHMPSLAERKQDIPYLADHYIKKFTAKHGKRIQSISPEAMRRLSAYKWPGNIRQLMNVLEQSVVLTDSEQLQSEHLPTEITADFNLAVIDKQMDGSSFAQAKNRAVREIERQLIEKALQTTKGNVSQAARLLKMKRQFLQQKMAGLALSASKFKSEK